MKLALVFLVVFVATSYQQQYQRRLMWMSPYAQPRAYYNHPQPFHAGDLPEPIPRNRAFLVPTPVEQDFRIQPSAPLENDSPADWPVDRLAYSSPNPRFMYNYGYNRRNQGFAVNGPFDGQRFWNQPYPFYPVEDKENDDDSRTVSSQEDDETRMPYDFNPESRANLAYLKFKPKSDKLRFGFGTNFIALATSTSSFGLLRKTVGTVTTTTVNITSVVTCIPANEFSSTSPTTCRRRRRFAVERFHLLEDDESINPTGIQTLEPTNVPSFRTEGDTIIDEKSQAQFPLVSSQSEEGLENEDAGDPRGKRSWLKYTTTTTFTSYSFYTTSITKTVSLASTSSLLCIPCSYVTC